MKILDYIKNNKAEVSYIKYVKAGERISYTIKNELHTDCLEISLYATSEGNYGVFNMKVLKSCYLIFETQTYTFNYGESYDYDYVIIDVIEEE